MEMEQGYRKEGGCSEGPSGFGLKHWMSSVDPVGSIKVYYFN